MLFLHPLSLRERPNSYSLFLRERPISYSLSHRERARVRALGVNLCAPNTVTVTQITNRHGYCVKPITNSRQ